MRWIDWTIDFQSKKITGKYKIQNGKAILISSALKNIIGLVYTVSATIFFNIRILVEVNQSNDFL